MSGKRGLDLRLFQRFWRGASLNRPQPPKFAEQGDSGGLTAQVDYLIPVVELAAVVTVRSRNSTVPATPRSRRPHHGGICHKPACQGCVGAHDLGACACSRRKLRPA